MNKAIFLDRDGTINVEKNYLYKIEEFEFLPGAMDALRLLQNAGYLLMVITNQSGIARGYFKEEEFKKLNDWMIKTLEEEGVHVTEVYYCPHHPEAKIEKYKVQCGCRKPKLGLFHQAIKDYDLDVVHCFAIGDKIRDCSICKSLGCKGFLIAENEKADIIKYVKSGMVQNVDYAEDLLDAAKRILNITN